MYFLNSNHTRLQRCVWVRQHILPLELAANHHLFQLHNVGMPQPQQQVNLSEAADGDSCQKKRANHQEHVHQCCNNMHVIVRNHCYLIYVLVRMRKKKTVQVFWHYKPTAKALTIFFFVHSDLLQSYNLIRLGVSGSVYKDNTSLHLETHGIKR